MAKAKVTLKQWCEQHGFNPGTAATHWRQYVDFPSIENGAEVEVLGRTMLYLPRDLDAFKRRHPELGKSLFGRPGQHTTPPDDPRSTVLADAVRDAITGVEPASDGETWVVEANAARTRVKATKVLRRKP